jgi:DNA-binding SARP family transcriptional activator
VIRFNTLGPPSVERGDARGRVQLRVQPKQLALLAYLSVETSKRPQRRDRIVYLLWPELDQARARAALSQSLYRLRSRLGAGAVRTAGNEELTVDPSRVWCDAVQLHGCITDGRTDEALRLYGGDFLEGFHLAGAPEFERWQSERREWLRESVVAAAVSSAAAAESARDPESAIEHLRRALEISPLDELVIRRLLVLLNRAGRRASAVQLYETFAARLAAEYGLTPAPETHAAAAPLSEARLPASTRHVEPPPLIRSIAVLALRALNDHRVASQFAAGFSDELLGAIGRLQGLRIIAGSSSLRFVSGDGDPRDVSRKLDVDAVFEGSVQVHGDAARIRTRLIDGRDGAVVWSRTFGRGLSIHDLFSTQAVAARAIANALRIELDPALSERLSREPTGNLEAYSLCLQGRHAWSRRSPRDLEQAQSLFRRSIALDPAYAQAWSGLADTLTVLPLFSRADPDTSRRAAREAARRAVELDEGSAEAHAALARSLESERRWDAAGRAFRRALELNPNYATARHWYANHLLRLGEPERGLLEIERATRLDPLSPSVWTGHAFILYLLRRYDRAIDSASRSLAMASDAEGGRLVLALAHAERGDASKAIEICTAFRREFPEAPRGPGALAYALAKAGEAGKSRNIVRAATAATAEPLVVAAALAALGDHDGAFRRLETADWGTINVDMIACSAAFDPLRRDQRFVALRKHLGLAPRGPDHAHSPAAT